MLGLERVLAEPRDVEARGSMLLGAAFAGTAIENSMLGAAHAAANPLTARYGLVHGQAVGVMLPAVMVFNANEPEVRRIYTEFAAAAGIESFGELIARLETIAESAGMHDSLKKLPIVADDFPALAVDAAKQWTGTFNPRAITADDFEQLYREVLG
jgi:alcohol dehydrogenase